MIITILTPTYNRKNLLPRLYESLCSQTDQNFEWLVIDDGSTDGTEKLISSFKEKAPFEIQYIWKENGGKHTALNYAYPFIMTPLTFIVDSDDRLISDAVAVIKKEYSLYKNESDLCGYSFLRGKPNGEYLSDSGVPKDGMKESFVECRINRGIGGDMAEVWYTECLKKFPFPVFQNEKFLGEDIVWIKMSSNYKMRFFNKVIYISEYLPDGLTINRRKNNIASPNGCIARAEAFLGSDAKLVVKIKAILQYYIYGRLAQMGIRELFHRTNYKLAYILLIVPAHLIYIKWINDYS